MCKCLEFDFLTTFEKFSNSGYHEFVKGKCNNFGNWEINSLYLDEDLLEENQNDSIYNLFNQSIDKYDQFGISYVDANAWGKMKKISQNGSDNVKKFISELNDFAEDAISNQGVFTILGI